MPGQDSGPDLPPWRERVCAGLDLAIELCTDGRLRPLCGMCGTPRFMVQRTAQSRQSAGLPQLDDVRRSPRSLAWMPGKREGTKTVGRLRGSMSLRDRHAGLVRDHASGVPSPSLIAVFLRYFRINSLRRQECSSGTTNARKLGTRSVRWSSCGRLPAAGRCRARGRWPAVRLASVRTAAPVRGGCARAGCARRGAGKWR